MKHRSVLLALLLGAVAVIGGWRWQGGQQAARGQALYRFGDSLPGRLVGQAEPLPSLATRCSNCHEAGTSVGALAGPGVRDSAERNESFAPRLSKSILLVAHARRRGPPSAFDADKLCVLLRTGVDPAQIMISDVMPRYVATAAQCADLWAYLTSR